MDYLKKKKMYNLLKSVVNEELEIMKYATYKFYRGSEWLECCTSTNYDEDTTYYKMYRQGYFVSIDISRYDSIEDEIREVDRITYRLVDGKLIKTYQRTKI